MRSALYTIEKDLHLATQKYRPQFHTDTCLATKPLLQLSYSVLGKNYMKDGIHVDCALKRFRGARSTIHLEKG